MSIPSSEQRFWQMIADRDVVRPSVRSVIFSPDRERILVQRPSESEPGTNYAFIGGEYEVGDTFESRIRTEIDEETNATVVTWRYLFVVENRFVAGDSRIHGLEHYVEVTVDREDVVSNERHLVQEWIDVASLPSVPLRPYAVRDLVYAGTLDATRHVVVDLWNDGV